jgi:hypothetical protein
MTQTFYAHIINEILDLNHNIDQMDLADVYTVFHPPSAQYIFFSAAHGTFSKTDHILWHKASLSKYKKIEIIPCILSNHNTLKLELSNKNKSKKHANRAEVFLIHFMKIILPLVPKPKTIPNKQKTTDQNSQEYKWKNP